VTYNNCGCEFDICVFTEEKGFVRIKAKDELGNVYGLIKPDVNIKGMRFANGLMWYGGNYEIGGLIQRDDEYIELIKTDVSNFFNNNEIKDGNIALLCAIDIGDYKTYVAAVAYMGSGIFYFSSKIYNVAQVWKNSEIILPDKNSFKSDGRVVDLTNINDESEVSNVTNVRIFSTENNARYDLYKQVILDLKTIGIEIPDGTIDVYSTEGGIVYSYNHDKGLITGGNTEISFKLNVDLSNVFSNHFHLYWCSSNSNCFSSSCDLLFNGTSYLAIPRKGAYLYFTGSDNGNYKAVCLTTNKEWDLREQWTTYSFTLSLKEGMKFSLNTPDNNLVEYEKFTVPLLPADTLNYQEEDINAILGDSKIITYTKD